MAGTGQLIALATLAFGSTGLLLGARLQAETTAAVGTVIYLTMVVFGNVMFPLPDEVTQLSVVSVGW
jgi:hypothetical protein